MRFRDRTEAGLSLAKKLKEYKDKDVIVYALPRGGVITAVEIARQLRAPLDLIITRKISHPYNPEYAIAATAENGHILGNRRELTSINEEWLEEQIDVESKEALRRRKKYLQGRKSLSPKGKIAILVDDGVATGLTLRVGILELKHLDPEKLIVAVPVVPSSTARILQSETDELATLEIPPDDTFLGAVSAYYYNFDQVSDEEVISTLKNHDDWLEGEKAPNEFLIKKQGQIADFIDFDEP